MQAPHPEHPRERLKDRLRGLLAAGAGTLVVASTVVVTAPAMASTQAPAASVIERVEAIRAQRLSERLLREPGATELTRLTWHTWHDWRDYKDHDQVWNNVASWHNVGYQDSRWQNWQNWHDWPNRTGEWGNRY